MRLPPNPLVHEIGTWVWLHDLRTRLGRPVTLAEIKADPAFKSFALVRMSRLSVMPVSEAHWRLLCEMGGLAA